MAVFLSLATLVKPTTQYVPIIIALVMIWDGRKNVTKKLFSHIGIVICLSVVFLLPWAYRNHIVFGTWSLSAQPAYNIYLYLTTSVLSIAHNTDFPTEFVSFLHEHHIVQDDVNLWTGPFYTSQAISILKNHKVALLESAGLTTVTFFTHDGILSIFDTLGIKTPHNFARPGLFLIFQNPKLMFDTLWIYLSSVAWIIVFVRLLWYVVVVFFFLGIWLYIRKNTVTPVSAMAIILILYFLLTTVIVGMAVNNRYRFPVHVFIFAFALYGLTEIWTILRAHLLSRGL